MKVISIYNNKGGVGKTTTTKMLAKHLCTKNNKVLLIDMDPQENLSSQYQVESTTTINDVLCNGIDINRAICQIDDNLSIVTSSIAFLEANNKMLLEAGFKNPATRLKQAINNISQKFDYILIDCPPTMDLLVVNSLAVTDEIIIPIKADSYSLDGINMLIRKVDEIKNEYNDNLKIKGIYLNCFKRSNIHNDIYNDLKENLQGFFCDSKVGEYAIINKNTFYELANEKELNKHQVQEQFANLFEELEV